MVEITLKIKGVHYAVHPDYNPRRGDKSTEEMEQRTIDRLRELDEKRPEVILVPEPDNPVDPNAVRAWCEGDPIGRVDAGQTSDAYCLFSDTCRMAVVQIDSVEVQQRGNFIVKAIVSEEALSRKPSVSATRDIWKKWRCDIPKFTLPEGWNSCRVLEFMIENLLAHPDDVRWKELTDYLNKWIDRSLHDFSAEAMDTRNDYIRRIRALGDGRLEPMAKRLEKQISAICGDHRMVYRMDWWKKLQHSDQMEKYWDKWRSGQGTDNLRKDLYQVDTCLRRMPDGLYSQIGDVSELFSALRYRCVPRGILWDIYTLLLLRQRICRELGMATKPLPIHAYGVEVEDNPVEEVSVVDVANKKENILPRKSQDDASEARSLFHDIVQHEEPDKLVERLHQLIDGRKGADVGSVLLKCLLDGHLSRKPNQKEYKSEFILVGGWTAIHNYMDDNNENALDRANKIIIF